MTGIHRTQRDTSESSKLSKKGSRQRTHCVELSAKNVRIRIWQAKSLVNHVSRSTLDPNRIQYRMREVSDTELCCIEHQISDIIGIAIAIVPNIENVEKRRNIIEHLSSHIEHRMLTLCAYSCIYAIPMIFDVQCNTIRCPIFDI